MYDIETNFTQRVNIKSGAITKQEDQNGLISNPMFIISTDELLLEFLS